MIEQFNFCDVPAQRCYYIQRQDRLFIKFWTSNDYVSLSAPVVQP